MVWVAGKDWGISYRHTKIGKTSALIDVVGNKATEILESSWAPGLPKGDGAKSGAVVIAVIFAENSNV